MGHSPDVQNLLNPMKTPKTSQPTRHLQRGFTLTELLVVIAIIAVLASLAFMATRKIRDSASAAVDASDLRTIGASVMLYASDNNILPTTSGGVGPEFNSSSNSLSGALAPYLGYEDLPDGTFMPEFAAASWQNEKAGDNGPSLLVMHRVYSGNGTPSSLSRPDPCFLPFGYPFGDAKRDGMTLEGAISTMGDPSNRLMLTEIDRLHPNFKSSTPSWLDTVPEKMAHGSYRLGLYWDGHVSRLDVDLNAF